MISPPKPPSFWRPVVKHLYRRKPVTIAAGFVYDQGLVFCADTKISTQIKTNESKITFLVSDDTLCAMTFAISSEDVNFPRSAVSACWNMVSRMDFSKVTMKQ